MNGFIMHLDYVPRRVWTVFATWYAATRYRLGTLVQPKVSLDGYQRAHVPDLVQKYVLWPATVVAAMGIEALSL